MAWSTRQLAELAGTTLKAVRHYHDVGLLDEPDRAANGYKRYRVEHLVRVIRIRRLTALGVPLAQVGAVLDEAGAGSSRATLEALDADLATTIEQAERARAELAVVLAGGAAPDVPSAFVPVAHAMSEADRALLQVYSRMYRPEALEAMRAMLTGWERTPLDEDFERLDPSSPPEERQRFADVYAPQIAAMTEGYEWLTEPEAFSTERPETAGTTVTQAMLELYNEAQIDVFVRVNRILAARARADPD